MNIAINGFDFDQNSLFTEYKLSLLTAIAQRQILDHFYIITHTSFTITSSKNISFIELKISKHQGFSKIIWQNITLPSIIKKYKIDYLLSFDNPNFNHKKTKNILLATGSFHPKKYDFSNIDKIGFLSQTAYFNIENNANDAKITVLSGFTLPEYKPLLFDQKEHILLDLTEGKEYFSFTNWTDDTQEIITILKAFSIFKKKQTSTWKLVIILHNPAIEAQVYTLIKNYKYKADIKITVVENHAKAAEIIAGSYCYITTNEIQTDIVLHQAFQTCIPVIASNIHQLNEYFNEAYIAYKHNGSIEDLAEKIIYIYKDENLGNSYIGKSKEAASKHNQNQVLETISKWMI